MCVILWLVNDEKIWAQDAGRIYHELFPSGTHWSKANPVSSCHLVIRAFELNDSDMVCYHLIGIGSALDTNRISVEIGFIVINSKFVWGIDGAILTFNGGLASWSYLNLASWDTASCWQTIWKEVWHAIRIDLKVQDMQIRIDYWLGKLGRLY